MNKTKYFIIGDYDYFIYNIKSYTKASITKYDYIRCYEYFINSLYLDSYKFVGGKIIKYIKRFDDKKTKEYYADISCSNKLLDRLIDTLNNLGVIVIYNDDSLLDDELGDHYKKVIDNTNSYKVNNNINGVLRSMDKLIYSGKNIKNYYNTNNN